MSAGDSSAHLAAMTSTSSSVEHLLAEALDHAPPANREVLANHLRDLVGGLLAERSMLRNECWMLAAPTAMAATGTSDSAAHHIRTYVTHLERMVAELSDRVADLSDDDAEVDEHRYRAERHRTLADSHAGPFGVIPGLPTSRED